MSDGRSGTRPGLLPVPVSIAGVTDDWLRAALRTSVPHPFQVARIDERIGRPYGLASELARIGLEGVSCPSSVVVKLWSTKGPSGTREVAFYRLLADRSGARVPVCHHAAVDEQAGRGVLVLEDLADSIQGDCLEEPALDASTALALALASVHAAWWERAEILEAAWLPEVQVERPPEWIESRTREFLERFGDRISPIAHDLVDRGAVLQARACECLRGAPRTLLHGDLHLDNVLFERGTGRPVLLDWARVARGPYVHDLVEFLFGVVRSEDRKAVLVHYVHRLREGGVQVPEDAAVHRHLGGAILHTFVRWTLGVARWHPESERESRMLEATVRNAMRAIEVWRELDPALVRS